MTINHTTLLLDYDNHDLCLDAYGNIAVAAAPYSIAQDVATQVSTFLGECWYDTSQGVPYWQEVLGQNPPASLVSALIEQQALLVPDVASVTVTIAGVNSQRNELGQILVTDTDGNTSAIPL